MSKTVLVTGGAGYIGSHACLCLLEAGFDVVVIDNLSNGSAESLARVERLSTRSLRFYQGDIRDRDLLAQIFADSEITAVMHFAGLKAVGESVALPLSYYENNVGGTLALLQAMEQAGVRRLIFSSSATVYGEAQQMPVAEEAPLSATNPYGQTKLQIEQLLRDCAAAPSATWQFALLRYFNPAGAHPSGEIGEDPHGIPNNLLPYVAQVAAGIREQLAVFGSDYSTPDGTGVRDYIHVQDLVAGHVAALRLLLQREEGAFCRAYNLGTGCGHSVLEVVDAFEQVTGRRVAYQLAARRAGDVAVSYADCARAAAELGWRAKHNLTQMLADGWRWQQRNPQGYLSASHKHMRQQK